MASITIIIVLPNVGHIMELVSTVHRPATNTGEGGMDRTLVLE